MKFNIASLIYVNSFIFNRIAVTPRFPVFAALQKDGVSHNGLATIQRHLHMKVYINAIEGYVPDNMVCIFHACLEFYYIARHNIIMVLQLLSSA